MPRFMPWLDWPHNLSFRPAGRKPVKGGRWSVRRSPIPRGRRTARRWRAWSHGSAARWNRGFETHAEAVAWAQHVALLYAMHGRTVADQILEGERKR